MKKAAPSFPGPGEGGAAFVRAGAGQSPTGRRRTDDAIVERMSEELPTDLPSLYTIQGDLREQLAKVQLAISTAQITESRRQGELPSPWQRLYRIEPVGPNGEPSVVHREDCPDAERFPFLVAEQARVALRASPPVKSVPCDRCL